MIPDLFRDPYDLCERDWQQLELIHRFGVVVRVPSSSFSLPSLDIFQRKKTNNYVQSHKRILSVASILIMHPLPLAERIPSGSPSEPILFLLGKADDEITFFLVWLSLEKKKNSLVDVRARALAVFGRLCVSIYRHTMSLIRD